MSNNRLIELIDILLNSCTRCTEHNDDGSPHGHDMFDEVDRKRLEELARMIVEEL